MHAQGGGEPRKGSGKAQYRIRLDSLYATQPGVGYIEVEYRKKKILAMSGSEYSDYERKKVGRVEIRNGEVFLIDGSHMANAAYRAGKNSMWVEEIHRPLDGKRRPSPTEVVERVIDLPDAPFRSLSWAVREVGGYDKAEEDYVEFRWADYLEGQFAQAGLSIDLISRDTKQAVREALKYVHLPEAANLPGYKPRADYTPAKVEKKLSKLFDED